MTFTAIFTVINITIKAFNKGIKTFLKSLSKIPGVKPPKNPPSIPLIPGNLTDLVFN